VSLLVHCGQLFDGTGAAVRPNATLAIADGVITDDPPGEGAETLDLGSLFVMPGFVDAHSHVSIVLADGDQWEQKRQDASAQALRAPYNLGFDVRSGTTTLRVMGEENWIDVRVREAIRKGYFAGPDLICATRPFSPSNGFGRITRGFDGVDEIRREVRENLYQGADFIKVFATAGSAAAGGPMMSEYSLAELETMVQEAERGGTYVAAHAVSGPGIDDAVAAGVRTIEHAWGATDGQIEAIIDADVFVVNTLGVLFSAAGIEAGEPERLEELQRTRERVAARVRVLLASGVRLALGTDHVHGGMPYELQKAMELGLSPQQALVAATAGGAQALAIDDRIGTLVAGKRADLIAFDGDPLSDPTALDRVRCVVKAGKRIL
jgi:imidazolonepropionase-like amidohydrolase